MYNLPMENSNRYKIRVIACCAIVAALVCAGTFIRIHLPPVGHVNFGDAFILICVYCLQKPQISHIKHLNKSKLRVTDAEVLFALSGGLGSALCDLLTGYAHFALATLIIKSLVGLAAIKSVNVKLKVPLFTLAEIIMVAGYFIAEIFIYDLTYSVGAIFPNVLQGACAVIIALTVTAAVDRILKADK